MPTRVLVDAGPLVAYANERDANHKICLEQFSRLPATTFTSWAVMVEATWIVRKHPTATDRLFDLLIDGALVCLELDYAFAPWFKSFHAKYRDIEPQVADASLVYLSQRDSIRQIFTLDRRDFRVYSADENLRIKLLPPQI